MTTAEFIARLESHTDEPLIFSAAGARVPGGTACEGEVVSVCA